MIFTSKTVSQTEQDFNYVHRVPGVVTSVYIRPNRPATNPLLVDARTQLFGQSYARARFLKEPYDYTDRLNRLIYTLDPANDDEPGCHDDVRLIIKAEDWTPGARLHALKVLVRLSGVRAITREV